MQDDWIEIPPDKGHEPDDPLPKPICSRYPQLIGGFFPLDFFQQLFHPGSGVLGDAFHAIPGVYLRVIGSGHTDRRDISLAESIQDLHLIIENKLRLCPQDPFQFLLVVLKKTDPGRLDPDTVQP